MSIFLFSCIDYPTGMATTAHCHLIVKGIIENNESSFLMIPFGSSNTTEHSKFKSKGRYENVPFFFMNKTTGLPLEKRNRFMMKGMFKSAIFLVKRKFHKKEDKVILYAPDFIQYFPILICCFLFRIPFFVWQIEKMSSSTEFRKKKGRVRKWSACMAEKQLPRIAKGMIVISSNLKEYYKGIIEAENILVSPILVNPNSKTKISQDETNLFLKQYGKKIVIVYSGNFAEKDGFPYILNAFKRFTYYYPESILLSTGEPGKYNPIETIYKLVNDLGLTEKFSYLGLVSRKELTLINTSAHLLLVCRSNSVFANFGFPWKLGEYCMTTKPIIATRVGDLEKYFTDGVNIFLAYPEDHISISDQMIKVFENYTKALEIANNGYINACRIFNYKTETGKVVEFVNNNH